MTELWELVQILPANFDVRADDSLMLPEFDSNIPSLQIVLESTMGNRVGIPVDEARVHVPYLINCFDEEYGEVTDENFCPISQADMSYIYALTHSVSNWDGIGEVRLVSIDIRNKDVTEDKLSDIDGLEIALKSFYQSKLGVTEYYSWGNDEDLSISKGLRSEEVIISGCDPDINHSACSLKLRRVTAGWEFVSLQ